MSYFTYILKVVAGAHYRVHDDTPRQTRRIKHLEYNEDWNNPQFNNDIAIITVTKPFDFSDPNVQPIEMFLSADATIPADTICNSTGWGQTNGYDPLPEIANPLQWAQLPIHSREECEEIFPGYITDGMICAGGPGHTHCHVSLLS